MGPPPPTGGMGRAPGPVAAKMMGGIGMGMGGPTMGGMGMGMGGGFAAPPGMRPPTSARPGTGASSAIPAGMRPPTAGGSAAAGLGGVPIPLQTDVNVVVRPVTGMASGVSGMPTRSLGPGRQIADKTYYLSELNKKLSDITRELASMRTEMDRLAQDHVNYAQLERAYESRMKDVRHLEGQLADFNLAFDKLRTHTNVQEIEEMYLNLKARNESEKRNVDEVFLRVQQQEKQTRDIEDRISSLHSAAADRIASLGEEKQNEYLELQDELQSINQRISEREGHLQGLEREIASYEDTMKSESWAIVQRGTLLSKEIQSLQKSRADLEEELSTSLSPQEVKERLTERIKELSGECAELDTRNSKLETQLEKLQSHVRTREAELNEAKKHSNKAAKYEAIYERDAKMSQFISDFASMKNAEVESKRKVKETIVALLKHISKEVGTGAVLSSGTNVPDGTQLNELRSELSFKEEKMAASAKTLATLEADLLKRKEELAKVESLDSKIGAELVALKDRMRSMNEEMDTFKSEEEMRDENEAIKLSLSNQLATLQSAREGLHVQVQLLQAAVERESKELSSKDSTKRIDGWETKLKTHAGAAFTLQEFILNKKREADFESLIKECEETARLINQQLIQGK